MKAEGNLVADVGCGTRSSPISIKGKSTGAEDEPKRSPMIGDMEEAILRKWCTGLPPKQSLLRRLHDSPPRARLTRRSTLADRPELDHLLATALESHEGNTHLPLTFHTIRRLSPFWKGAKPIANYSIFERLLLNKDVNQVHADDVVAALKLIGPHCKHLVIVAPIHTSEYGDVFNRETRNINTGNDWEKILACFPNLETVLFQHPGNEPTELQRNTFFNFQRAVCSTQLKKLKTVKFSGPPKLLTHALAGINNHPYLQGSTTTPEESPTEEHFLMN